MQQISLCSYCGKPLGKDSIDYNESIGFFHTQCHDNSLQNNEDKLVNEIIEQYLLTHGRIKE